MRSESVSDAVLMRRSFLGASLAALPWAVSRGVIEKKPPFDKAQIAITLDLEMSRNFPTWNQTHWDYEKGNLDAPTKQYAVEAARRVKERGGVVHFFAVGQTMEQEDVSWLRGSSRRAILLAIIHTTTST